MAAISAAAIRSISDYAVQELMNPAWAYSGLAVRDSPLLEAIASSSIRQLAAALDRPDMAMLGTSHIEVRTKVLGLVEAMTNLGCAAEELVALVSQVLGRTAGRLDAAAQGSEAAGEEVGPELAEADPGWRCAEDAAASEEAEAPRVLGEQRDLLVLWKPAGWTVSVREVEEEAEDDDWMDVSRGAPPFQDWVAEKFGASHPICLDSGTAYGLLHRLDRGTSGAILCAKSYRGYLAAKVQFATRRVCKRYVCLCHGLLPRGERWLEAPLRYREPGGGLAGRSFVAREGDRASTQVQTVGHLWELPGAGFLSLVEVELGTGRKHQIRAHLSEEGHPLVADVCYGGSVLPWCKRVFLHAHRLCIDLGEGEGPLAVGCPLPVDLLEALERPVAVDAAARALHGRWLQARRPL